MATAETIAWYQQRLAELAATGWDLDWNDNRQLDTPGEIMETALILLQVARPEWLEASRNFAQAYGVWDSADQSDVDSMQAVLQDHPEVVAAASAWAARVGRLHDALNNVPADPSQAMTYLANLFGDELITVWNMVNAEAARIGPFMDQEYYEPIDTDAEWLSDFAGSLLGLAHGFSKAAIADWAGGSLEGTSGIDILISRGNATLRGGSGGDVFAVGWLGNARIEDFSADDVIALPGHYFGYSLDELLSRISSVQHTDGGLRVGFFNDAVTIEFAGVHSVAPEQVWLV
ncbi:MAG: hypothetical protein AB1830_17735 [Pseudomonadota bacterium]|jgi:hypothetical protein